MTPKLNTCGQIMNPIRFFRFGATLLTLLRQKSAVQKELQKRPAGHTAGLFLSLNREYFANSSPEVKHRHALYPAVIPQTVITSPKL
jgi:hypothetical protein